MCDLALSRFGQFRRAFGRAKSERDSVSLEREAIENVFSAARKVFIAVQRNFSKFLVC